eukprot:6480888-Amphidinium_carterae.1
MAAHPKMTKKCPLPTDKRGVQQSGADNSNVSLFKCLCLCTLGVYSGLVGTSMQSEPVSPPRGGVLLAELHLRLDLPCLPPGVCSGALCFSMPSPPHGGVLRNGLLLMRIEPCRYHTYPTAGPH